MEDVLTSLHVLDAMYPYALGTFGVLLGLVAVLESFEPPHQAAPRGEGNTVARRTALP
jgi:hypothetical protein